MLSQGKDPEYMANYFGWAFEFLKNYLIWESALETAKNKLAQIRHDKRQAEITSKNNAERIPVLQERLKQLRSAGPKDLGKISDIVTEDYDRAYKDRIKQRKSEGVSFLKGIPPIVIVIAVLALIGIGGAITAIVGGSAIWLFGKSSSGMSSGGAILIGLISRIVPIVLVIGVIAIIIRVWFGRRSKPDRQAVETELRRTVGRLEDEIVSLDGERKRCRALINQLSAEEPIAVKNLQDIEYSYNKASEMLKKHHSIDVMPPDSRELLLNLDSIALLRYYLRAGICDVVTGHDGIYALYRKEIREDIKHAQIMGILGEIRDNQLTMLGEMQRMNATLSEINSSVSDIKVTQQGMAKDLSAIKTDVAIGNAQREQIVANTNYMRNVMYDEYMRRSW